MTKCPSGTLRQLWLFETDSLAVTQQLRVGELVAWAEVVVQVALVAGRDQREAATLLDPYIVQVMMNEEVVRICEARHTALRLPPPQSMTERHLSE